MESEKDIEKMKEKFKIKIFIYTNLVFLCILIIVFLFIFKSYLAYDKDLCLDTGYCKEGLIVNTELGQIIVNQENCIKTQGTWIYDKKYCQFK